MTDRTPARPRPAGEPRPAVLLGDVTASSVTAWSVLGELRALPPSSGAGDSRQPGPTASPRPPPLVEPVRERPPETRPRYGRSQPGEPPSREQGQRRERRAQLDRQEVAQQARDQDTRQRQGQPRLPTPRTPGGPAARQDQSTVRWTAQPTARGAPQRSTATGPGGGVTPPTRARDGWAAPPKAERSSISPVRIIGLVVVVLVLAGRCLSGLT